MDILEQEQVRTSCETTRFEKDYSEMFEEKNVWQSFIE